MKRRGTGFERWRSRRMGREIALQIAYSIELRGVSPNDLDDILMSMPIFDDDSSGEGEVCFDNPEGRSFYEWAVSPGEVSEGRHFAGYLVRGTLDNIDAIDQGIERLAEHWLPDRMAVLDRTILRLSCFELLYAREMDIPPKVTINEWIEIAKIYSTENSGAFINGILDRLNKERPEDDNPSNRKKMKDGKLI